MPRPTSLLLKVLIRRLLHVPLLAFLPPPPPRTANLKHLKAGNNLKKRQLAEERYADIERENMILLQRMSSLMHDNKKGVAAQCRTRKGQFSVKSLNGGTRKRELMRITAANLSLLNRIQAIRPSYDRMEWAHDRKKQEKIMSTMREFPLPKGLKGHKKRRGRRPGRRMRPQTAAGFGGEHAATREGYAIAKNYGPVDGPTGYTAVTLERPGTMQATYGARPGTSGGDPRFEEPLRGDDGVELPSIAQIERGMARPGTAPAW